jgi:MFS family permease
LSPEADPNSGVTTDAIGEASLAETLAEHSRANPTADIASDPALPRADGAIASGLAREPMSDGAAATGSAAASVFEVPRLARALRHRDFRLFWTGNFISNIGTWMQNIAQGWLVLKLTNSAFWLGLVGFSASIPILFFALIGGVIADHVNKRKLLMVTQSAMMVFAFAMAGLTWFHVINVQAIVFLALGTGIAMSLNTPSYQALVSRLLPREDLTNGIALNSAQFNMSRVIGPTLGGFAMALVGEAGNFFLNGLSFLAVIVALTRINYHDPVESQQGDRFASNDNGVANSAGVANSGETLISMHSGAQAPEPPNPGLPDCAGVAQSGIAERAGFARAGVKVPSPAIEKLRLGPLRAARNIGIWPKMKEGFAYVFNHPEMSSLIFLVAIGSLLAIPYLTFVPYFARDVLHTTESGLGLLMACSGAGAFLGAITIASLTRHQRRGRFVLRGSIGFFTAIMAFTFSRNFYLSGLLLMAAGYCMIITAATINSLLQHLAADHMRGRVMSIYSTAFLGFPPIGCLIAGSLSHLFTAPHVIAAMSSLAFGGSLAVYVHREGLRGLD